MMTLFSRESEIGERARQKQPARHHQAIDTRDEAYKQVAEDETSAGATADRTIEPDRVRDLGARQQRVYRCILSAGTRGRTNSDIAAETGLPANVVTPRTYELRGEGKNNPLADDPLVVPLREQGRTGERVKRATPSGARAQVWVAVAALQATSAPNAQTSVRITISAKAIPIHQQCVARITIR